jgi:acetyl-CoA synthetase
VKDVISKASNNLRKAPNLPNYDEAYKSFSWNDAAAGELDFYSDGKFNAAHNIVDRHATGEKKHKVALHYANAKGEKEQYTFADLKTQSDKFANVLTGQHVEKGDRVFIFLPSIPERYVAFLGILKTGAIAGTMFSAFQEIALLDRLSDSEAKVVITNAALYPRIERIWHDLPKLEKVIVIERGSETLPDGKKIVFYKEVMEKASETFTPAHLEKDDFAYMLYTSGTTGKPKGVVHSHFDVLQALITTKYVLDLQDDDVYWCTADLGWVTGVVYGVLGPWGLGATSVIYEGRYSPEAWYGLMAAYKVTVWYTAPTAIRMLMGAVVNPKDYDLSSLRHLCSVGEPLNPEAVVWANEKIGLPFHDTWWQTELGGISITNFPSMDIKIGSMGKPLPGIVAAIIDDQGKELPAEEEGNLALKASTVSSLMRQIWNNEKKFHSYFMGEWYISGDRAYKDSDGYFWFIGRADDVINTMGERVGPFEVESALVEHPSVVEAGVIGKPDDLRGEIIKAFVVTKPDIEQTEELKKELQAFVKKNLAGHAYPREISFIDKLPKTRSGKIMRRVLKAQELGLPVGDTSTLEDY